MQVSLTNTLTGKKKIFVPRVPGAVALYVCGVTPYDYAHIGHGRCYTTFDMLYRLLNKLGYAVTYIRNFTDIDDKLLTRAEKEYGNKFEYTKVASRYIDAYTQDMAQLGCVVPTHEPRVTGSIQEIITFIAGLVANGHAYVVNGDVYYRVRSFADYGKLSHRNIDDLKVGARVAVAHQKEDPLDFALWKSEDPGTFWESPWGAGRPGWHIECSAMAHHYLGETIDIHGGGMDLIFPHHENEIAQSEGLFGVPFANCWVHNAFVRINQEKMSKSLGNFFTLRQIFERFDPMVVRYYFLMHHYRNPLDFAWDDVESAQKSYQRLCKLLASVDAALVTTLAALVQETAVAQRHVIESMINFLCDDLNTSGMFGVIFEQATAITAHPPLAAAVKAILQQVVGLSMAPLAEKEQVVTPEITALLAEREAARAAKNWALADKARDHLRELGYEVQDKKKL